MIIRKVNNALSSLYFYFIATLLGKRVMYNGRVIIKGLPIIEVIKGSQIKIGNRVTLNSSNYKYHISMFSPVKLIADGENATISIGDKTRVHGSCIHSRESIIIGKRCLIAANSNIIDCNGHDFSFDDVENRVNTSGGSSPIVIEDDVWIGTNCLILPGTIIGKGSIISAGSVVKGEFPSKALIGGSPAKVIKQY